jgi:phenylacetate-CoA ligase
MDDARQLATDRAALTRVQLAKLRAMLHEILPANAFYARKLAGIAIDRLQTLDDLARLPFTTKQELVDDQAAHPPYGSNLTYPLRRYCRLHQTSGTSRGRPLRWLDTRESWDWFMHCWRLKYETVGLTPDDRLFFPFSFGPFIGFWAAFEGAFRLGNLCLPGGGMTSAARLRFLMENDATVICCTPTYALRLAEVARQEGIDLAHSAVRILIVAGEPGGSIPATRRRIEEAWGARVFDHTGMTEIGSLGIECPENPLGVHMLETECIPEVIDAATGERLPPGREGELVLTNLGRWGSPLVRYRTGDRVLADPDPCPCGRVFLRLKGGIRGRTDDMIIIRGNNVYPSALEDIIRRFPAVEEFRIEVDQSGPLTSLHLLLECPPPAGTALADAVRAAVRTELNFRPVVTLVPPGTLPRAEMKSQRLVRKM